MHWTWPAVFRDVYGLELHWDMDIIASFKEHNMITVKMDIFTNRLLKYMSMGMMKYKILATILMLVWNIQQTEPDEIVSAQRNVTDSKVQ